MTLLEYMTNQIFSPSFPPSFPTFLPFSLFSFPFSFFLFLSSFVPSFLSLSPSPPPFFPVFSFSFLVENDLRKIELYESLNKCSKHHTWPLCSFSAPLCWHSGAYCHLQRTQAFGGSYDDLNLMTYSPCVSCSSWQGFFWSRMSASEGCQSVRKTMSLFQPH